CASSILTTGMLLYYW
nr:immunoglobulin heavy chain junction region [Macaca mulatta]MOW88717.1 immunoglobulin heavy chain junction region [Macaca mulatta]MOW89198.1 immunoglobulin heavy chain junction region [Macaca mulatta]MOW89328.1 immunoglobulin heavy chain junction region [Macaca mulatta]MOW89457.1 immunoglobulin heavy chain junction region [Macaca mulatta]